MAIHLLTQSKTCVSAMALKRQLGVNYDPAWRMKPTLLQAMKEVDEKVLIGGIVQLDDVYWGSESRGRKRGRGAAGKTSFVAAVALDKDGHPTNMKMTVVGGFRRDNMEAWVKQHVHKGRLIISDKLACFRAVTGAGCEHISMKTSGHLDLFDHSAFK